MSADIDTPQARARIVDLTDALLACVQHEWERRPADPVNINVAVTALTSAMMNIVDCIAPAQRADVRDQIVAHLCGPDKRLPAADYIPARN